MKRMLFINSSLSSGGSEKIMTMLANQFSRMGYAVSMVLLREKQEVYHVDSNVKLIKIHYCSSNKLSIALIRFKKLRSLLKSGDYDLAVSFMYDINIFSLLANMGVNLPLFISERADPRSRDVKFHTSKIYSNLEFLLYRKATGIILQTELIRNYYPQKLQEKINVIANPINSDEITPYKGTRDKKIVAIGRLTKQKNYPLLLKTFASYSMIHTDYVLEIYGSGELRHEIENQIKLLNISKKVHLMGFFPDVLDKIKNAGMYISTSNYEGISNSMLEAMALGIPCICTDCPVGGAALVINDGENGFLVPTNDENILLDRMELITLNAEVADKISKSATYVKERFSLKNIALEWEKVFNKGK